MIANDDGAGDPADDAIGGGESRGSLLFFLFVK